MSFSRFDCNKPSVVGVYRYLSSSICISAERLLNHPVTEDERFRGRRRGSRSCREMLRKLAGGWAGVIALYTCIDCMPCYVRGSCLGFGKRRWSVGGLASHVGEIVRDSESEMRCLLASYSYDHSDNHPPIRSQQDRRIPGSSSL